MNPIGSSLSPSDVAISFSSKFTMLVKGHVVGEAEEWLALASDTAKTSIRFFASASEAADARCELHFLYYLLG
jgi:hypothetical protein